MRSIGALFILFATPAIAANWLKVSTASNGATGYLDVESLKVEGKTRTFWMKVENPTPDNLGIKFVLSKTLVDCAAETVDNQYVAAYKETGESIGSWPDDKPAEPVIPGSRFESIERAVCK